jgi:hypothetical protein
MEHSVEEQEHADKLCARIVQLGGDPQMNPSHLTDRSHSEYVTSADLTTMIREDRQRGPDQQAGPGGDPRQGGGARRRSAHLPRTAELIRLSSPSAACPRAT